MFKVWKRRVEEKTGNCWSNKRENEIRLRIKLIQMKDRKGGEKWFGKIK